MIDIKTLVEVFDVCRICNVISGLHFIPDRIIYICRDDITEKNGVEDVEKFLKKHTPGIIIEYIKVKRYDYEEMCTVLERIVKENEDVVFDLTGGFELLLTAMGAVSEKYDVPMLSYNVKNCSLIRVKNTKNLEAPKRPRLDIDGCISLNGGRVVNSERNITDSFGEVVCKLWEICSENPQEWNRQTNSFSMLERFSDEYDNMRVSFDISQFSDAERSKMFNERIIRSLINMGAFSDFKKKGNIISYRYKNDDVKRCVLKAGNILELYTFITASCIKEKYREDIDDVAVGVILDWDGKVHDIRKNITDIRNEVDVMLAKKLMPVFISCKNGEVHKEALYELDTVAEHYGGKYAEKIMVATYVSSDENSRNYIIKRAEEMGIILVTDVDRMSYNDFLIRMEKALF